MTPADSESSRAEQLRQRRAQETKQRINQVGTHARKAVPPPNVTVRGSSRVGTPIHQSARSKNRRQYYMINTAGAEVRLPAIPVVNPGWRLLSASLVVVLGLAIFMAFSSSTFQVDAIKVKGLQRLAPSDVQTALALSGSQIFEISPAQVAQRLHAAFPELTNIQVSVSLPKAVNITVREKQPVMAWEYNNQTLWIDDQGSFFPARGEITGLLTVVSTEQPPLVALPEKVIDPNALQIPEPTPSTEPPLTERFIDPAVMKAAIKLSALIPQDTRLAYSNLDGLGWQDSRGWTVFVGTDFDQIDLKLSEYQTIVNSLTQQGITPSMISVKHVHAPFYRVE